MPHFLLIPLETLAAVLLHQFFQHVVADRKMLLSALLHSTLFRSRRLRVSMSQILLFQIDGKYLLIKSAKRPSLCPIGGVVRYFDTANKELRGPINFQPQLDGDKEKYDLRGFFNGRNFAHFLRWYAAANGREQYALAREIEEEFNEIELPEITQYVSRLEFIKERLIHEGPKYKEREGYWEYRQFEIYRLEEECDTSKRLADFMRSKAGVHPALRLVDTDEICRGQTRDGAFTIAGSCGYLFGDCPTAMEPPRF
jgi:hypothetical protein